MTSCSLLIFFFSLLAVDPTGGDFPYFTHPDSNGVIAVAFGPKGSNLLASGANSGSLIVWDVTTGKSRFKLDEKNRHPVFAVAIDPKGKFLASVSENSKIKLWKLADGSLFTSLSAREVEGNYLPRAMVISPDGKYLAAGGMSLKYKAVVQVWETDRFEKVYSLEGHEAEICALSFGPNSKFLAAADKARAIKIWNLEEGRESRTIDTGAQAPITTIAFKSDWTLLSCADNKMRTWDPQSGKSLQTLFETSMKGEGTGTVDTAAWSPSGKRLAFSQIRGLEGRVLFYETPLGKISEASMLLPKHARHLAWSADGNLLAVGNQDGRIYLFEVPPE